MTPLARRGRRGISFIEVVVIVGILLLLLAFLIPAVARVRQAASRTSSQNNLKQLALAVHNFHDTYSMMPPAVGEHPKGSGGQGTAHFYILPFLEQNNLFQQAENRVSKNGVHSVVVPLFLHPEDQSGPPNHLYKGWLATTNYAANWMVFKDGGRRILDIADGTSNTFMFAERYQMCNGDPTGWGYAHVYPWAPMFAYYSTGRFQTMPKQEDCDPKLAQSLQAAGITTAFCDGSVRLVADSVSPRTWMLVCDPGDGNPIPNDL